MFEDLLRLYEKAQVNAGEPKSIFGETFLFNEGWLLAGVLSLWQRWEKPSALPFLPFPKNSLVRAPVQLYTSFRKTKRSEALGETNTRADGVAGHFQKNKSKSGVTFRTDLSYFAAFEAKMYSRFSPIKNAKYSQASRTIACMIHSAIKAKLGGDYRLFFVTLYPADSTLIRPSSYPREVIEQEIAERIVAYKADGRQVQEFERGWKAVWDRVKVVWATWEQVKDELQDTGLERFYSLCKDFNKKKAAKERALSAPTT